MAIQQLRNELRELEETVHRFRWSEAVKHGHINMIEELLHSNPSNLVKLNDKGYFDYYLIIKALANYQINIAKLLIEHGFRVYKRSKSVQEITVLHAAVQSSNDTEFISTLLAKGASPDILAMDKENKTPFHLAIDKNQSSTVKLFSSKIEVKILDGKNFIHYAVERDMITIVTALIREGFSINRKNEQNLTPFCVAWKYKRFEILNHLLSFCTGENMKPNNYNDIAPVYIASMCGYLKLVKKYANFGLSIDRLLMSNKEPWACLIDYSGFSLLHIAVLHTKLKVVKYLLSAGADITVQNNDGSTPLHIAFENKEKGIWETWQHFDDNNSIIDLILQANMKMKSNPVNKNRLSHFHVACSRDEPTVVEHFFKNGALINQPTKPQCHLYKGFYPLHFAAKFRCIKTLETLLKNGADVKKRDFMKKTALHIAAQESCLETVRLLLEYGADITSIDSDGNSPVHWAFKTKNYAVIDLLLSNNQKIHLNPANAEGLSHFHIACTRNNVQVVKNFIENGESIDTCVSEELDENQDSSVTNWAGCSPLHFAVLFNRARNVQLLLDYGASVELKNMHGCTPLHLACQYNYETFGEYIKTTLNNFSKRGKITLQIRPETDVSKIFEKYFNGFSDCTGKFNWLSNRIDQLKIINSLLKYKSDVNSIDFQGNTPIFYAYAVVAGIRCIIQDDLDDCSDDVCDKIVDSLSEELLKRRKLILNNLLKMNANLDTCHKSGSILHYICSLEWARQCDNEIIELFLKNGADANIRNKSMLTPLHQATLNSNRNLISTLLDYGAEVDSISPRSKSTALLIAASNTIACNSIMKVLIDKGANVHARNSNGKTALHQLTRQDEIWFTDDPMTNLIKAGANINSQDLKGRTPLHLTCSQLKDDIAKTLLLTGADINVEDNQGRSVCCYLYDKYLKDIPVDERNEISRDLKFLILLLQDHVMKMKVIGLSISEKELLSFNKFHDFVARADEEKMVKDCEDEVKILRDTKINDYYSLYNVIFKKENALSKLVKNRKLKCIVESKSFVKSYLNYGYLVKLKYQAGLDRAKLLPTAKNVLYDLIGLHLPDTCSENIFSYFSNFELSESIRVLSKLLNYKERSSDTMQLRRRSTQKRQKLY